MDTREITASFPSGKNMVGPVRDFVGEIAGNYGFTSLQTRVELCTEEIVTNIINHAYMNDPNYRIDLHMTVSSRMVELSFAEKGIPFDPSQIKPFDFATLEGGLGITLVKSLTDKILFENLGREGKRVTITFISHQPEKPVTEQSTDEQKPLIFDPAEITYRQLDEEDAIQLSRLAWLNYGYSYEDYIYFPDELKKKLHHKAVISFGAWHNEKLVGHVANKSYGGNPKFPEIGIAIVDPAYRKNNIFSILSRMAVSYLEDNHHDGFYVRAVTNHIISQREAVDNLATTATNILLCVFAEMSMKNLENSGFKMSAITYARLIKQHNRQIFLPERYRDLIMKIYKWSGVEVKEIVPSETKKIRQNKFSVLVAKDIKSAFISFEEIGDGFEHIIRNQLKELATEGYPSIFLYLNLSNPEIGSIIEFLNGESFIFSGVQFNYFDSSDALVMQRITHIDIDFSNIKIYSEEGKLLLAEIEKEYRQYKI